MEYRVWECKIVIKAGTKLPRGFDSPPRFAAVGAVEKAGIEVIGCFSGWGGALTEGQKIVADEENGKPTHGIKSLIIGDQKDIDTFNN